MAERDIETSATHPIEVGWLRADGVRFDWRGALGLTHAPGRTHAMGPWDRDLTADLERLREHHGAGVLVSLLEDREIPLLGIEELPAAAARAGLEFITHPVPDFGVPIDDDAYASLVRGVLGRVQHGERVVVHCMGGRGRSGTFGGSVLVAAGMAPADALAALADARGPRCPETAEQRSYIERFA